MIKTHPPGSDLDCLGSLLRNASGDGPAPPRFVSLEVSVFQFLIFGVCKKVFYRGS